MNGLSFILENSPAVLQSSRDNASHHPRSQPQDCIQMDSIVTTRSGRASSPEEIMCTRDLARRSEQNRRRPDEEQAEAEESLERTLNNANDDLDEENCLMDEDDEVIAVVTSSQVDEPEEDEDDVELEGYEEEYEEENSEENSSEKVNSDSAPNSSSLASAHQHHHRHEIQDNVIKENGNMGPGENEKSPFERQENTENSGVVEVPGLEES